MPKKTTRSISQEEYNDALQYLVEQGYTPPKSRKKNPTPEEENNHRAQVVREARRVKKDIASGLVPSKARARGAHAGREIHIDHIKGKELVEQWRMGDAQHWNEKAYKKLLKAAGSPNEISIIFFGLARYRGGEDCVETVMTEHTFRSRYENVARLVESAEDFASQLTRIHWCEVYTMSIYPLKQSRYTKDKRERHHA